MIIATPKETKRVESAVGLTPNGVSLLVIEGHDVLVQSGAGEAAGFSDDDYQEAGADLVATIEEIYDRAELIIKVEEPQPSEYKLVREDQIILAYFYFSNSDVLLQEMKKSKAICIAYESVRTVRGGFPLLDLMNSTISTDAKESTLVLTRITLEYISKLADMGYAELAKKDKGFANAIQLEKGVELA